MRFKHLEQILRTETVCSGIKFKIIQVFRNLFKLISPVFDNFIFPKLLLVNFMAFIRASFYKIFFENNNVTLILFFFKVQENLQ